MSAAPAQDPDESRIATEAERWLGRHDRGLDAAEMAAFLAWRAASPAHGAEFDRLAQAWRAAESLQADAELVQRATRLEALTRTPSRRYNPRVWATGLAAAAVVALAFFNLSQPAQTTANALAASAAAPASRVDVQPSTARELVLPDGSIVRIRGDSVVEPAYSDRERRVRLVRGEAHFAVRKDPSRPFIVDSRGVAIRAVGTAFNVADTAGALDVLVTEGVVALEAAPSAGSSAPADSPQARAGERATIPLAAGQPALHLRTIAPLSPADIDRALAWQTTRLTFRAASLADALAAFNTHGGARIELADPTLSAREVSGTFRADRAEAFVRLLEQASEVRVERAADGRVRLHPPG